MDALYRMYDWIGHHARTVTIIAVVLAIGLAGAGSLVANTDDANFDPPGEVFDIAERADTLLQSDSTTSTAAFLVEAPGGNALSADALREWHAAAIAVRASDTHAAHLVDSYDADTETVTPGVFSIVDIIDSQLPNGIDGASTEDLDAAVAATLASDSPFADVRFSLSELTTSTVDADGSTSWDSPAFMATITYDENTFDSYGATELWLRDVQSDFKADTTVLDPIGVAIDSETTFQEAAEGSAPFIFLAVALIVLLIAAVHRSYWSAVVAAAGLGATSLAYYGTSALLGLKMGSLLLAFIVPIAMIGFGVDFFIHGVGRVREMQRHGKTPEDAYPAGMRAVIKALTLAATTSIAAFLVNGVSGTEAITEFGFGAAISLAWAYLFLGQLAPRIVIGLEQFVSANPKLAWKAPLYWLGTVLVAVLGGLMVALTAVAPIIGAGVLAVFVLVAVAGPALATRRRNRKAVASGRDLRPALQGAGHGLKSAGTLTWFVARWRRFTLPIALVVGGLALMTAFGVQSGFDLKDFYASDTDFVQSIDRLNNHFPSSGEGSSFILVEGDLTDPATLAALDDTVARLDSTDAEFGRNSVGELSVRPHAGDLVRMTMASPSTVSTIEATGVALDDRDANGIPDTAAGVKAIYDYISVSGVPTPTGGVAIDVIDVPGIVALDGQTQATLIKVQVGSFTDAAVIVRAWDELDLAASALETQASGVTASVSGDVITNFEGMNSFTSSMLTSLPLAIILTLIIASAVLRSIRFAAVSVVPIGFVVAGIYAFMAIADFSVNVVTATIAAIAVGVGIDFSTHFTARFREELELSGDPLVAARLAGEGTGGALVLSAVTSVLGFTVMATAPTPIFATFGLLTAVMIALSLAASLLVLPSLLVMATPKAPAASAPVEAIRTLVGV